MSSSAPRRPPEPDPRQGADRVEPLDTEVVPGTARDELHEQGFTGHFAITDDGRVRCHTCDEVSDADQVTIQAIHRYEGITNPGDEESVMGLSCPNGCQGTLTTPTGIYADSAVGDAVRAMRDARR